MHMLSSPFSDRVKAAAVGERRGRLACVRAIEERPEARRSLRRSTILAAASIALLCVPLALLSAPAQAGTIEAVRVDELGPLVDLEAAHWKDAPAAAVTLLPQTITPPVHPNAAVLALEVRAAHNGQWLALRMEWADPTESDRIVSDEFGDQVAVQMPVRFVAEAMPSPMMGNPGGRVSIVQWRAAFQRDLDEGVPELRDLYPYALVDTYPDEVLRATDARPYQGAISVDNPMSHPRRSPLLEQTAEGWGTLTVKPQQSAEGRGAWSAGRWRVVIAHPLGTGSANDPQLGPGGKSMVAFAVWEGGNNEVGGRKSWSPWVPIQLGE